MTETAGAGEVQRLEELAAVIMALVLLGGVARLGLVVAGAGVVEHRQFVRLDRRLAALRTPAP